MPRTFRSHLLTVVSIAICAFILTDIAHEILGHGGAYALLGGKSLVLTTTRVFPNAPGNGPVRTFPGQANGDLYGRLFSIAGPIASFLLAVAAILILKTQVKTRSSTFPDSLKLFLWLSSAFSLFWACGYMVSSALTRSGDYFELLKGTSYLSIRLVALVLVGGLLFLKAANLLSVLLQQVGLEDVQDIKTVLRTAYLSAICIAAFGAALDPRGPIRILKDALPETLLANFVLLRLPREGPKQLDAPRTRRQTHIPRSVPWLITGAIVAALYIAILGPGISVRW